MKAGKNKLLWSPRVSGKEAAVKKVYEAENLIVPITNVLILHLASNAHM